MISDRDLLRISIVVFVAGLVALFVVSQTVTGDAVAVSDITENMIGDKVSVSGTVDSIQVGKTLNMYISDSTGKMRIVMFNPPEEELQNGDAVIVAGKIDIYRGELEITANKILKTK